MDVTSVYFSATGTTKKGVEAIGKALDENAKSFDISMYNSVDKDVFLDNQDVVVFGVPVYGGRVLESAIDRLKHFKGNNTPCVLSVTFGNRDFDDALLELSDTVKANGFVPIAAAMLIGEHTYGKIQVGRPNKNDVEEDVLFAKKVANKLKKGELEAISVPGNRPYRKGATKGGHFTPLTSTKCVNCGQCAKLCPSGAIDKMDFSKIDSSKCISCFRCIRICPVGAKNAEYDEYINFAKDFSEKINKVTLENKYLGV